MDMVFFVTKASSEGAQRKLLFTKYGEVQN